MLSWKLTNPRNPANPYWQYFTHCVARPTHRYLKQRLVSFGCCCLLIYHRLSQTPVYVYCISNKFSFPFRVWYSRGLLFIIRLPYADSIVSREKLDFANKIIPLWFLPGFCAYAHMIPRKKVPTNFRHNILVAASGGEFQLHTWVTWPVCLNKFGIFNPKMLQYNYPKGNDKYKGLNRTSM